MAQLTAMQAGQRLGVTDRTILNYINRGLLPAEKMTVGLDWKYVIDVQELEAFAERQNIPLRALELDNQ